MNTQEPPLGPPLPIGRPSLEIAMVNRSPITHGKHEDGEAFPVPVPYGDPLNLHATMFCVLVNDKNK
jgi:hypothetical protein